MTETKKLQDMGYSQTPIEEIAELLGTTVVELKADETAWAAYRQGKLNGRVALRVAVMTLALEGNVQAQKLALEWAERMDPVTDGDFIE